MARRSRDEDRPHEGDEDILDGGPPPDVPTPGRGRPAPDRRAPSVHEDEEVRLDPVDPWDWDRPTDKKP